MSLDGSDTSNASPVFGRGEVVAVSSTTNETIIIFTNESTLLHVQSGVLFRSLESSHLFHLLLGKVGEHVVADGEGVLRVGIDLSESGVFLGEEGSSEVELLDGVVALSVGGEEVHEFDVVLGDGGGHSGEGNGDEGLHVRI